MNLRRALRLARACELAMHAVYDDIAQLTHDGDPRLVDVWQRMALVETQHAEIFEQIIADLDERAARAPTEITPRYLEVMLDELLAFRERLAKTAMPMDEIFSFALDMEVGEQNGILRELLDQAGHALGAEIRSDIATPASQHIGPILDAIERLSEDTELRARARGLREGQASSTADGGR